MCKGFVYLAQNACSRTTVKRPELIYLPFLSIIILQADLNTTLSTASLQGGQEVRDVVPRMPVKTGPQPLLVKEMGNQTDTSAKDEETVEHTHLQIVLSLLGGESTTVADEVDKADGNAAINVKDKVILLGSCHGLDRESVVEQLGAWKVLLDVLFDKLDTEIGVVTGLDPVTDTGDCVLLELKRIIQWLINLLSLFSFLMLSTKSRGLRPLSNALLNSSAAPSRAPPKREPMVKRPETNALMRSLPARVVMMVFMAPDTAGP